MSDHKQLQVRIEAGRQKVMPTMPEGAQALIIASEHINDCGTHDDYYGHKTRRVVAIGWRMSKRESFKAMRKAAATFAPTAPLATGPSEVEHRENYSMGAGNYLKDGWIHHDGWCVRTEPIDWLADGCGSQVFDGIEVAS